MTALCPQSSPFLQLLQATSISINIPCLHPPYLLTQLRVCRGRKATTTTLILATLRRIPITNNKTNWIILPFVFKMGFVFSPCQTIFYRFSRATSGMRKIWLQGFNLSSEYDPVCHPDRKASQG